MVLYKEEAVVSNLYTIRNCVVLNVDFDLTAGKVQELEV